jgi:hypothetical protein
LIYVSSRVHHAPMWRRLRDAGVWSIEARWLDEPDETDPSAELPEGWTAGLWIKNVEDVRAARVVVFYAEPGDFPLKGAYVEVGVALGLDIPVFAVLPGVELEPRSDRPVGSWIRHPCVRVCPTLEDALRRASRTWSDEDEEDP